MTLVGYGVLVGVPVISTAWVELLGPNIAASILAAGMGYSTVFIMCTTAAIMGLLIYGGMYLWLRRTIPALATAS